MSLTSKVLITGGAGFIGSNLADGLIREGARVVILDNFLKGFQENLDEIEGSFEFIEGDVTDPAITKKAVEGCEVIFHEAALPSVPRSVDDPIETHRICVDGTMNLLMAARDARVRRFVYAASS